MREYVSVVCQNKKETEDSKDYDVNNSDMV